MTYSDTLPRSERFLIQSFRWLALPLLVLLLVGVASVPMSWQQQACFGAFMVGTALVVRRLVSGRAGTLVLVIFSLCATTRYATWRIGSLERYFTSPWQSVDPWNAAFMLLLIGAEAYSFLILYLGYLQTTVRLRRPPAPMPADLDQWPSVDLLIPTFNEPMDVVRSTILAAKQLDWPADRLRVLILDDGDRAEFRTFAEEAGVEYIARPEHSHAKAGNINYALLRTSGELVAIFDCDHVPTRSFLQMTVGWFLRDSKLGMLQTPHHFYSGDPFERNLGHFRHVPNEAELFYGIIQDANDLWNATFFCGSCALLRRTALAEAGHIAHETVTEDAHTSLRMQKLGWNTAYLNLAQAGGLATETLGGHVKQRIRWSRGMTQILRIDNPLFARGLALPQRLCYLTAMLHFLYALPRLIFLTAPILYLVFGKLNIPGYWLAILMFAGPHLILSTLTNSRIQGHKRYSFWNEIYETVLSPYILLPTLFALISPRFGKFNVTAKGQNQQEDQFDGKLARPFLVLLGLNGLGLCMALPRFLFWDRGHAGTILMNVVWTGFNIVVLGVALSICYEARQRRGAVRVSTRVPVAVESRGTVTSGMLENLSTSGAAARISGRWTPGERVRVSFPTEDAHAAFPARIVATAQGSLRLALETETLAQQEAITRVLYGGADRWLDWTDGRKPDSVFKSLLEVLGASVHGFSRMLRLLTSRRARTAPRQFAYAGRVAAVLLVLGLMWFFLRSAHGETRPLTAPSAGSSYPIPSPSPRYLEVHLPLSALGARNGVLLDPSQRTDSLSVSLPDDVLIDRGDLRLSYTLPESNDAPSTLEVLLNDTVLAAITPSPTELATGHGETTIPLPPELLVRQNRLTLRLGDSSAGACGAVRTATAPIRVDADSVFNLREQRLILASDLSLLPEPFVQRTATQGSELPVVFAHQPSETTLEAAGVLVSWFGSESEGGQTRYPAMLGSLPQGNAVVLLLGGESLPGLQVPQPDRPTVATVANPFDPYGKLLVLSAASPGDLLALTQALASSELRLSGESATLGSLVLPARRSPDDAPRWIHTRRVSLESLNGGEPLHTVNSNPLNLYLHLSPDYDFGPDRDMYVHLEYGDDAAALNPRSNLVVRLNGVPADSVQVRADAERTRLQQANLALGDLPASVFANTLQAQFYFVPPAGQQCASTRFTGTLGGGSYLDIGKASHLATLPNLRLFSNAGFPFTRLADMAGTAVLLPPDATPGEITLYLDLLGYFGSQTGYPALRVEVGDASYASRYGGKDLLVIGAYRDLAAMPAIAAALPLRLGADGWQLSSRARLMEAFRHWLGRLRFAGPSSTSSDDEPSPGGVIEGIESPFAPGRSVILLLAKDEAATAPMAAGLMAELPHDGIAGTVSLWQGGNFLSHAYSTRTYTLGDVGAWTRFRLLMPSHPVALLIGLLGLSVLLALWFQVWIGDRIRRRLMGVEFDLDGRPNPAPGESDPASPLAGRSPMPNPHAEPF